MPSIPYTTRSEITAQALKEIAFDRQYKNGKVKNWQVNEMLYYGQKLSQDTSRANVDLGRMQEFVHTLLSKIDNPLVFKFLKRKVSQMKRVDRLNALRAIDQNDDDWDIKDIAGKKQALIYGRAIYSYHADSYNGYAPHLENVDVYDFLIDPSCGGLDLERAMNMGRYGVIKFRDEIEKGVKEGMYLRTEAKELLDGSGNSTNTPIEVINQQPRTNDTQIGVAQKNIGNPDKFVFWEWYTTYQGDRYYLLLSDAGGTAIRIEKLSDIFSSNLWPFWSWASFVDLTEFWTPGYCDYVREIFMAQGVSINQLLDNAEQRNKPQRAVKVAAVKNMGQLKYQRGGNYVEIIGDDPVQNVIQTLEVPQLDTPLSVFNILEGIQEKASGVTAAAKGEANGAGKATIYEGNQAAAADRFGLLNKSYSFGYKRFATLWVEGVKEHLTKKKAVDILGPDGVELEYISRSDLFRKGDEFKTIIESSDAETALSELEKRTKIQFLTGQAQNPIQNPEKSYEIAAGIAGFDEDTIRQLLDVSEFGDADLMAEAERDIEDLIEGKKVKPNRAALPAYKQRFIDYMDDNEENLDEDQQKALFDYIDLLDPIIIRNITRKVQEQMLRQIITQQAQAAGQPAPNAPVAPGPAAPGDAAVPVSPQPVEDPMGSINQLAPTA